jgi:hypothetical protein
MTFRMALMTFPPNKTSGAEPHQTTLRTLMTLMTFSPPAQSGGHEINIIDGSV